MASKSFVTNKMIHKQTTNGMVRKGKPYLPNLFCKTTDKTTDKITIVSNSNQNAELKLNIEPIPIPMINAL